MMTQKSYELLARVINKHVTENEEVGGEEGVLIHNNIESLVSDLCYELKKDNPNFQSGKFKDACGF